MKTRTCALLFALAGSCFAINITVTTKIKDCSALGFTVVGKASHGGLGHSYSKSGMPKGAYYGFGFRHSLFGRDVTCYIPTKPGKKRMRYQKLNRDTTVELYMKDQICWQKIKASPSK